jgi:hypothetical protein
LFNFKLSGIAAGVAFVLSLLFGLFGGAGILVLLFRALIFAAVFFGLFCLGYWLVTQFLPELLNPVEDELGLPTPGSRVDISLGDERVSGAFPSDNSEIVDDIAGAPSTPAKSAVLPLDQGDNAGYNSGRGTGDDLGVLGSPDEEDYFDGGKAGQAEVLPDIDGLTETMPESSADGLDVDAVEYESSEQRRPASSSRKGMAGDFDPKELAQAIQTVLKKDEKG